MLTTKSMQMTILKQWPSIVSSKSNLTVIVVVVLVLAQVAILAAVIYVCKKPENKVFAESIRVVPIIEDESNGESSGDSDARHVLESDEDDDSMSPRISGRRGKDSKGKLKGAARRKSSKTEEMKRSKSSPDIIVRELERAKNRRLKRERKEQASSSNSSRKALRKWKTVEVAVKASKRKKIDTSLPKVRIVAMKMILSLKSISQKNQKTS